MLQVAGVGLGLRVGVAGMLTWHEVHAQQCEDEQIERAVIVLDGRHGVLNFT